MSASDARPRHLSAFHFEAMQLGAASADERAWASEHLAHCPRCTRLAAELEAARAHFRAVVLPATSGRLAQRARGRHSRPRRLWLTAALLLPVAAAGVMLRAGVTPRPAADGGADPDVLAKGGPVLSLVARRHGRILNLRSGEKAWPGDQIRFVLKNVEQPFVLIASVDGAGKATIYVPYDGAASAPVATAAEVTVDGSIVLDDAAGPERVFAFFSARPLRAAAVRAALQALGKEGPAAIRSTIRVPGVTDTQSSVLIEKMRR